MHLFSCYRKENNTYDCERIFMQMEKEAYSAPFFFSIFFFFLRKYQLTKELSTFGILKISKVTIAFGDGPCFVTLLLNKLMHAPSRKVLKTSGESEREACRCQASVIFDISPGCSGFWEASTPFFLLSPKIIILFAKEFFKILT